MTLDSLPSRAELSLGVLNAGVADVLVNGVNVGSINRVPERVDCTSALRLGENRIEFMLYTTLRNIVGPFHRPQGEVGYTFGGGYVNPDAAWLSIDISKPGWQNSLGNYGSGFIKEYNLSPLGVERAILYMR